MSSSLHPKGEERDSLLSPSIPIARRNSKGEEIVKVRRGEEKDDLTRMEMLGGEGMKKDSEQAKKKLS